MRSREAGPVLLLVLAALLGVPEAAAQYEVAPDTVPSGVEPHRLIVTPVLGIRGALVGNRSLTAVAVDDFVAARFEWGSASAAGPAAGLEADLRLAGRVGIGALGLYLGADDVTLLKRIDRSVVSETVLAGPEVWVAAAALSVRLPTAVRGGPDGYLLAGPAWIRQDYGGSTFDVLELDDRVDSPGIWIGYRALFPVGMEHAALSVALEDIVPIWNREGEDTRLVRALNLVDAQASAGLRGAAHLPMLRAGLAFRF